MELLLNSKLSVEKNAELYFQKFKKCKGKIETIKKVIERFSNELSDSFVSEKKVFVEKKNEFKAKKWFHSFRWFVSSENFLCVGGRDSGTNELLLKRYVENKDLVFHTDLPGSPFFVIKANEKVPGEQTILECAIATASFSRAWRSNLGSVEVYWVFPEQLSKTPKSGEFLSKGSFIVSGKRNYLSPKLELGVGFNDDREVVCAPLSVVKKFCKKFMLVVQGSDKVSDVAKKIIKYLGEGDINEIVRVLPSGGVKVVGQ